MADSTLMNVLNARQQLLVELASLTLLESLMGNYVVEELAIGAVLHDEE